MHSSTTHKGTHSTIGGVLRQLVSSPFELFVHRWNWKASLLSAVIRACIYLFTNVSAGWKAAAGAMAAEFAFRVATAGFYASFIQAFRSVKPVWHGNLAVLLLLPVLSLAAEYLYHFSIGTPNFRVSFRFSLAFTAISALFNLFAMRSGTIVVGPGEQSLWQDFRSMPGIVADFLLAVPRAIGAAFRRTVS